MPSTTPRQATAEGSASSPASRRSPGARAQSAAWFACTVAREPPCTVVEGLRKVGRPRRRPLPTTMWSRRWRRDVAHKVPDRHVAAFEAAPLEAPQLARRSRSSSVSLYIRKRLEMTRPSGGNSETSALKSVPAGAGTARDEQFAPASERRRCAVRRRGGEHAARVQLVDREGPAPRSGGIVIAALGAAGGPQIATREPSASRAPITGVAGSSRSGRAICIAARRHLPGCAQSRTVAAVISTVGRSLRLGRLRSARDSPALRVGVVPPAAPQDWRACRHDRRRVSARGGLRETHPTPQRAAVPVRVLTPAETENKGTRILGGGVAAGVEPPVLPIVIYNGRRRMCTGRWRSLNDATAPLGQLPLQVLVPVDTEAGRCASTRTRP